MSSKDTAFIQQVITMSRRGKPRSLPLKFLLRNGTFLPRVAHICQITLGSDSRTLNQKPDLDYVMNSRANKSTCEVLSQSHFALSNTDTWLLSLVSPIILVFYQKVLCTLIDQVNLLTGLLCLAMSLFSTLAKVSSKTT